MSQNLALALQSTDPIFSAVGKISWVRALPWKQDVRKCNSGVEVFQRAGDDGGLERVVAVVARFLGRSETLARLCLGRGRSSLLGRLLAEFQPRRNIDLHRDERFAEYRLT